MEMLLATNVFQSVCYSF